jgi:hypothetical protein
MAQLLAQTAASLVLGVLLTGAIWISGLGYASWLGGLQVPQRLLLSYPFGLLTVIVAATASLLFHGGVIVGALIVAVGCAAAVRSQLVPAAWRAAWRPIVAGLPFVAVVAISAGLEWHGPSATVPARSTGDIPFYVAQAMAARRSLVHFHDLLVTGHSITYLESAPAIMGAAASRLFGTDLYLFTVTTLPTIFLMSMSIGFGLVASSASAVSRPRWAPAAIALLGAGSLWTVTFLIESPSVSLGLPLVFAVYALWQFETLSFPAVLAVATAIGIDLLLTKVLALAFAGLFIAALVLTREHLDIRRLAVIGAAGAALIVAAALSLAHGAAWLLERRGLTFTPVSIVQRAAEHLGRHEAAELLTVVGEVGVIGFLLALREYLFAAAFATTVLLSWVVDVPGVALQAGIAFGLLLLAVRLCASHLAVRKWAIVAALALAFSVASWFRDYIEARESFTFLLLIAGCYMAAQAVAQGRGWAYIALIAAGIAIPALLAVAAQPDLATACLAVLALVYIAPTPRVVRLTVALVLGVGALAVAVRAHRLDALRLAGTVRNPDLTSLDYDIWHRVGKVVPRDGLVFTPVHPGNTVAFYPALAGRQLYFGDAEYSSLNVSGETGRRKLTNWSVLTGRRDPRTVAPTQPPNSYFAVLPRKREAPKSFRWLYANPKFALYKIDAQP